MYKKKPSNSRVDSRAILKSRTSRLSKRRSRYFSRRYVVDRCLGVVLLVVMSPITAILCALVKSTSSGPGFYRQTRVGLNGKEFEIIKLRTMVMNAERPGEPVWCVKNDPRITRLGRVLRTLHLDELPQLWNVARGEMSLIGPRPERPEICKKLEKQIDGYHERTTVKPGVTGLAQINLPPDETVDDVRRKQVLDLHYIDEANWWLDTRMLLATAMRIFGVKGELVMKSMRLCRRDLLSDPIHEELESELQSDAVAVPPVPALAVVGGARTLDASESIRRPR